MTPPLSRRQSIALGAVVLAAVGLLAFGLIKVGGRQGLFADRAEVVVRLKEAHDITPGTAVRVKGVDAGSVSAVEYPEADGPAAGVTVRMLVDRKFADRLFADATARAFAPSPLGPKVIAIDPGHPDAGPLAGGELAARETPDIGSVVAKLDATASETQALLKDVRAGKGSLGKLVTDDALYDDLSGLAKDSRGFMRRADGVAQKVEAKADEVDKLVADSRGVVRSARQSVDAVQSLPVIRNYVTNADRLLNRPDCRAVVYQYAAADLFETDSFQLSDEGRGHMGRLAEYLRKLNGKVEVVIAAVGDPKAEETAAGVRLTEQRAAGVLKYIESQKGLKTSWFSSRKASAVGLGNTPSPLDDGPKSADYVQVVMFVPR